MLDQPPSLIWPPQLLLPPADKILIYLDLNHWISLAQAALGHPQGTRHLKILEACRGAKATGRVHFALSSTHYQELNKIKNPTQRRTVADVVEELSEFDTLAGRFVLMELELAAILDPLSGDHSRLQSVPLLGKGVLRTVGQKGRLRIMGPSGDTTEEFRSNMGAEEFDRIVSEAYLIFEQSVLRGPTDEQIPELSKFGWKPRAASEVANARAEQEKELQSILTADEHWRRGRLRDIVLAREWLIEFQNLLPRALEERNLRLSDVAGDRESARALIRSMPSTEVSTELKMAWHRNRDKQWSANDIYDIDALSVAVPYCDIVVTEKACCHVLVAAGLSTRMNTVLLRDLADLPSAMEGCHPVRNGSTIPIGA